MTAEEKTEVTEDIRYLQDNEIKNKRCDTEHPFAFISYAHNDDVPVIRRIFSELYDSGFNLRIDTANLPVDGNTWEKAAVDALASPNCKLLIFFRSQRSLVKSTIQREIGNFAVNGRTSSDIITVDLSHKEDMHTEEFMKSLENTDSEKFKYYANRIDGVIQSKSTNYSNPKLLNGAGTLYKEYQKEKRKTKYETDKIKYHEQMSKADQILEEYRQKCHCVLRNVYRILLTRGTKGCYIFCCDPQLQKYIKEQAERFNESLI